MQTILQNKLLFGTNNPGKLKELRALLSCLPDVEGLSTEQVGIQFSVDESGSTYQANALLKAEAYSAASGLPCLADDSGLEVEALGGAPGLHSARFSPMPGAGDADRRGLLIAKLKAYAPPWIARFRAVIAIVVPGGAPFFAEGVCEGEIIAEERGQAGFGYDPIFFIPRLNKTMAELPDDLKNSLSHRARAFQEALPYLQSLFKVQ